MHTDPGAMTSGVPSQGPAPAKGRQPVPVDLTIMVLVPQTALGPMVAVQQSMAHLQAATHSSLDSPLMEVSLEPEVMDKEPMTMAFWVFFEGSTSAAGLRVSPTLVTTHGVASSIRSILLAAKGHKRHQPGEAVRDPRFHGCMLGTAPGNQ